MPDVRTDPEIDGLDISDSEWRLDEWEPALVEEYPDVDSLEAFLWVGRFFRACHDAGETCFSSRDGQEPCVPSSDRA